jgi:hypothetical protein
MNGAMACLFRAEYNRTLSDSSSSCDYKLAMGEVAMVKWMALEK